MVDSPSITVVKLYTVKGKEPPPNTIRKPIHRGTPLGNPFEMKDRSDSERNRVCDCYEGWLPHKLQEDGLQLRYFQELQQIVKSGANLELVCFCAPKRCHGDTVKRLLEASL